MPTAQIAPSYRPERTPAARRNSGGCERRIAVLKGLRIGSKVEFTAVGPGGFGISLEIMGSRTMGNFGGLLQDFTSLDEALDWVERALGDDYRLRVDYVGDRPCAWTLERLVSNGAPVPMFASGSIVVWSWGRPRSVRYCRNGQRRHGGDRQPLRRRNRVEPTASNQRRRTN